MKVITGIIGVIGVILAAGTVFADDYSKTGTGPVKVFLLIGQSNMNGCGGPGSFVRSP